MSKCNLIVATLLIMMLLSACTEEQKSETAETKPIVVTVSSEKKESYYERSAKGPSKEMGAWEQVPLPPKEDRMQGVHTLLLPNGKILLANGSSNRNVIVDGEIQNGLDTRNYSAINNVGIFDPTDNSFRRIATPAIPEDETKNNDLFCSGQLHLPSGDILFAGGTQSYYGQEQFQGSKSMQVFDWSTETWSDVGQGQDGHWYPSLIPLSNGQLMVISGISFTSKSEISPWVEFYDPNKEGNGWQSVDISILPNSPWNTRLEGTLVDGMQQYPRIYPLKNDKFLITHDGASWSAANGSPTNKTYIMIVSFGENGKPAITFEPGPLRESLNRVYGTAVQDPTNGDILLFGGQEGPKAVNNNDYGPGPWSKGREAVNVVSDMERFTYDESLPGSGVWKTFKNFFGDTPEDARIMHFSTILPTKQLLIINGGNYAYHRPLFYPILLTPDSKAVGDFKLKQMNQALEPRLYHNISLLLPDGRVLSAGGNASRAAIKLKDGKVDEVLLNTYKNADAQYEIDSHGEFGIPAEIWRMEIFKPPYLFIDARRPEIQLSDSFKSNKEDMPSIGFDKDYSITVKNHTAASSLVLIKLGASTHAWDSGQRLIDLAVIKQEGDVFTFRSPKLNNQNVGGYYMLFYVSDAGFPSVAKIIQLNDQF